MMYAASLFLSAADVIPCHMSPLQWWHVSPLDWSNCLPIPVFHHLPRVTSRGCHVSCTTVWPVQSACHVALYGLYSHPLFFACLPFRTEHDILLIRSPFDKVNIPPESGRRDGRNGIGFIAFRALSFLSIFQALSGFWIRFRIKPLSSKAKIERQFLFKPCTNNTSLIEIELLESSW